MKGSIYKIECLITHKIYIGQTIRTLEQRFKRHILESTKQQWPISRALCKYGTENFTINEIEMCELQLLNEREKYWIEHYDSFRNGYNATSGGDCCGIGDANGFFGRTHSYSTKEKISKANKGRTWKQSEETKKKISLANKSIPKPESLKMLLGKSVTQISLDGNYIDTYYSITQAANITNINRTGINACLHGRSKHAGGYRWIFSTHGESLNE